MLGAAPAVGTQWAGGQAGGRAAAGSPPSKPNCQVGILARKYGSNDRGTAGLVPWPEPKVRPPRSRHSKAKSWQLLRPDRAALLR